MSSLQSLANSQVDVVRGDLETLAVHMRHCAQSRGRWFGLRDGLQRMHTIVSGRIVTVACAASLLSILVLVLI